MRIDNEKLPPNWSVATLREVSTKIVDGSHNPPQKQDSGRPMLSARNIENNQIVFNNYRLIADNDFDREHLRTKVTPGDVLLTIVGTIGRTAVVLESTPEFTLQRSVALITPNELLPKFLMYQFQAPFFQKYFEASARGTAQKGVYLKTLGASPVIVAPLEDQKQIVAEIEKQFSRLDEAVALLKRIQANLKRYKAAVLKAAVEGKLTEQWRKEHPDVEPSDQLLKRILAERRANWEESVGAKQGVSASPGFGNDCGNDGDSNMGEAGESFASPLPMIKAKGIKSKDDSWKKKYKEPAGPDMANLPELPELPEGWVWTALGQLAWSVKDGPHYSPKYSASGIPFISGGNIRPEGIDFSSAKFITPELQSELSQRCKPAQGDLLYTKGGTTGIARVNTETRDFNVWVHVAVLKLIDSIEPFYLQHALNSTHCYKQSQQYTHGVGNQDLGLTRMVWITVPLPPLTEQKSIVEDIDCRLSVTEELEATVETNLKRAERLRQTILQLAFSGGAQ